MQSSTTQWRCSKLGGGCQWQARQPLLQEGFNTQVGDHTDCSQLNDSQQLLLHYACVVDDTHITDYWQAGRKKRKQEAGTEVIESDDQTESEEEQSEEKEEEEED